MNCKFSILLAMFILALLAPIHANDACDCEVLPIPVGSIIGSIDDDGGLLDNLLGIDIDISLCIGVNLLNSHVFYKFYSESNNRLVLHGITTDIALNIALFTGDCDDLTCFFVDFNLFWRS